MIAIVDYGLGNVQAIANIYRRLGIQAVLANVPEQLESADRVILPGVGAFDWAMRRLNESGMRESLDNKVLVDKVPVIGICVGMQMMATRSDEGQLQGLDWIPGDVKKFERPSAADPIYLPHMGWNDVTPTLAHRLFAGLEAGAQFYFLHSYYFAPRDEGAVAATTDYCRRFAACVTGRGNIFGAQFHPEKSHHWGVRLLKNFAEL